jgi:Holliday junction resolvase RusA-like endonuclease
MEFVFGPPDKRKRDLDNLLKAPIDLLVEHGVIDDDRNVVSLGASWGAGQGAQVVVRTA